LRFNSPYSTVVATPLRLAMDYKISSLCSFELDFFFNGLFIPYKGNYLCVMITRCNVNIQFFMVSL
jgi:hypothetical protein